MSDQEVKLEFKDVTIDGKLEHVTDKVELSRLHSLYDVDTEEHYNYDTHEYETPDIYIEKIDGKVLRIFDFTNMSDRKLLWSRSVIENKVSSYDRVVKCAICGLNKTITSSYEVEHLEKAVKDKDEYYMKYYADQIRCWDCKELKFAEEKEQARLEGIQADKNRKKEQARLKEIQKNEPDHNEYAHKIKVKKQKYQPEHYKYQFLCGESIGNYSHTLESATIYHLVDQKCKACRILNNESKASIMNQDQVASLFVLGIDGKKSGNGNLYSQNGRLIHYRTLEALRQTEADGSFTTISNSQCWSAGFAKCPTVHSKYNLPLTTLQEITRDGLVDREFKIEMIEYGGWERALVKVHDSYYLIGRDENQGFITKLVRSATSINDAEESLKPQEVIEAQAKRLKVIRQGDLFFVPTKEKFTEYDKQHFVNLEKTMDWQQRDKLEEMEFLLLKKYYPELATYQRKNRNYETNEFETETAKISDSTARTVIDMIRSNGLEGKLIIDKADYISQLNEVVQLDPHKNKKLLEQHEKLTKWAWGKIPVPKELKRCQIMNTNHFSQYMVKTMFKSDSEKLDQVYVKGQIFHRNNDHRKLILEKWYKVLKNVVIQSWNVPRRGFGAGGD